MNEIKDPRFVIKTFVSIFLSLLITSFSIHSRADDFNVALVMDSDSDWTSDLVDTLRSQFTGLSSSSTRIKVNDEHIYSSDWDYDLVQQNLKKALSKKEVDVVVALGLMTSASVLNFKPKKPTIAASVIEPENQGFIVDEYGNSGNKNVHFLYTQVRVAEELKRFADAIKAKKIGLVTNPSLVEALPFLQGAISELQLVNQFKVVALPLGTKDFDAFAQSVPADVDGVFALPLLHLAKGQQGFLVRALNEQRIPTFSMQGRRNVEQGFLMGTALIPTPTQLAKRLAVDIRDLSLGRSPNSLPVTFDVKDRFMLNMETARRIHFDAPFDLMFEADVINEYPIGERRLTLTKAIDESIERNLDLASARKLLQSVRENTRLARAALLPNLSANASWDSNDRDLVGTGPKRTTSIGVNAFQSIYSESNWSNYTSQGYLELAEEASVEETRLDIIQTTVEAYLNVLIARTQREIQRDNLRLTLANLERAQFRYDVGSANRSEVLRFETELGNDRQTVSNAQRDYQQAVHQLNRILHRPITESFRTVEPDISTPRIFGNEQLSEFLSSNRQVQIFSDYLTIEALKNSPELEGLRQQIEAQDRILLAAKRKRYVPDVELSGGVNRIIDDRGALNPRDYDNDWTVGVDFNWALYQGSGISAEKRQSLYELERLKIAFEQTTEVIETNVRNSISQAGASKINIDYSKQAEIAAQKTLELVTDLYSSGKSSYIDLIDAQSSYLVARLASSNNVYQHLLNVINVQRAIGFYDFYVSQEESDTWFNELKDYAASYGEK